MRGPSETRASLSVLFYPRDLYASKGGEEHLEHLGHTGHLAPGLLCRRETMAMIGY